MTEISEDTHVDKVDAWDRNARKNSMIADLKDRAESAEAVLRVALSMMGDDDWSKEDVKGYLESSMAIINDHSGEEE